MDEVPLPLQFAVLAVLLIFSGFFSMAETAMMATNRHRLRHMAGKNRRGAALALTLLGKTDKLLGVILLGNTLINAAAARPAKRPHSLPDWYALQASLLFAR